MAKQGYSRKGFWGQTIHYDANGNKIGESRPNFWGGYDHYDTSGNKTGSSQQGFWGQMNHYDNSGKKTGESSPSIFGRPSHRRSSVSSKPAQDEYDVVEAEMMDECLDEKEAREWLEDNGYDPDEFDV